MDTHAAPADTRMMGIVHEALKRDLRRVREVLDSPPPPRGRQRAALGEHVIWMMDFLHAHHTSEDVGLWPAVLERNPAAAELLASLEADHAQIAPAAEAAAVTAAAYTSSSDDTSRLALVAGLDRLLEVLVPHLDREVADAMPVVAGTLTAAEWDAIEQEHNLDGKSPGQLAMEGHWLIEDIDPEGYAVVVAKVPALMRFVLIHGFGWAYRRRARARWTPDRSTTESRV